MSTISPARKLLKDKFEGYQAAHITSVENFLKTMADNLTAIYKQTVSILKHTITLQNSELTLLRQLEEGIRSGSITQDDAATLLEELQAFRAKNAADAKAAAAEASK